MTPGQTSAVGALVVLAIAVGVFAIGGLSRPAPIPADHGLALVQADGRVALAKPDGSAAAVLSGAGVPADAGAVRWAPGGDFLALRTESDVVVVDREGVVAWRHAIRFPTSSFGWSPDGSRLAIYDAVPTDDTASTAPGAAATDATIEVLSSTGVLEWKVPLPDGFGLVIGYGNLAWSHDGSTLAFTGFQERIPDPRQPAAVWLADVGEQSLRQLTEDANTFDYGPAWSADGQLFVAGLRSLESGIWRIDPAAGARSSVLRTVMEPCPVVAPCSPDSLDPLVPSPDGKHLAFREPTFGLSILEIATAELSRVQEPTTLAGASYGWSSDGAALLYLRHPGTSPDPSEPPDLVRFELASGATTVMQADVTAFDLLAVEP